MLRATFVRAPSTVQEAERRYVAGEPVLAGGFWRGIGRERSGEANATVINPLGMRE